VVEAQLEEAAAASYTTPTPSLQPASPAGWGVAADGGGTPRAGSGSSLAAVAEAGAGAQQSPRAAAARSRLWQGSGGLVNSGELEEALLYDFDESLEDEESRGGSAVTGDAAGDAGAAAQRPSSRTQDKQQKQQHWRARLESEGFRFDAPSRPSLDFQDWEATPFSRRPDAITSEGSGSLTRGEHSYLLTRRRDDGSAAGGGAVGGAAGVVPGPGPATPPCGLSTPLGEQAAYREAFVVHVEQVGFIRLGFGVAAWLFIPEGVQHLAWLVGV
jgi:hypothetical protein